MFCCAGAGENRRALRSLAQGEHHRQLARRQYSCFPVSVQHRTRHRSPHLRDYRMTPTDAWPKVAVVGAGAVGGYFGGMLARAGAPVVFIGRPAFVAAVQKEGLLLDTAQFKERVRVEASTELSAVAGADLILFCVKSN